MNAPAIEHTLTAEEAYQACNRAKATCSPEIHTCKECKRAVNPPFHYWCEGCVEDDIARSLEETHPPIPAEFICTTCGQPFESPTFAPATFECPACVRAATDHYQGYDTDPDGDFV